MIQKRNIVLFCLFLLIVGCSQGSSNSTVPENAVKQEQIYFYTSDFSSNAGYFYALNINDNSVTTLSTTTTQSNDINGYIQIDPSTGASDAVYYVTKFSGIGSTISDRIQRNDTKGNSNENTTDTPANTYDIFLNSTGTILTGYNQYDFSVISSDFNQVLQSKKSIKTDRFDTRNTTSNQNSFQLLLENSTNYFVITSGFNNNYAKQSIAPALIYILSKDLSKNLRDPIIIEDSATGAVCHQQNASIRYQDASHALVACNPYYANVIASIPTLFSIDVSGVSPIITQITSAPLSSQSNIINLGGVSKDLNSVFIYEQNVDSNYTSKNTRSYWLNLSNPVSISEVSGLKLSGSVFYNAISKSYFYGCYLDNFNICQSNTIVKQKADILENPTGSVSLINLNGVISAQHGVNMFKTIWISN